MWAPPDWAIWIYLIGFVVITGLSLCISFADKSIKRLETTDIFSLTSVCLVIGIWLFGNKDLTLGSATLLSFIIIASTIESTIRNIKLEAWENEIERKATTAFTWLFVSFMVLPPLYLCSLMALR
jgi:uncharacterized BrkB/YihY/UPF0761 family membrane protein